MATCMVYSRSLGLVRSFSVGVSERYLRAFCRDHYHHVDNDAVIAVSSIWEAGFGPRCTIDGFLGGNDFLSRWFGVSCSQLSVSFFFSGYALRHCHLFVGGYREGLRNEHPKIVFIPKALAVSANE